MSRFVRESALAMGGEVVMFAGGLLFGLITARTLGPYGKGVMGVLAGAYAIFVTVLSLRFERAVMFYSAARPEAVSKTVGAALAIGVMTVISFFPLYYLLPESAKYYLFGGLPAEFVMVAVLYLPNSYLMLTIVSLLAGQRRFGNRLIVLSIIYGVKVGTAFGGLILLHCTLRDFIILSSVVDLGLYTSLLVYLYRKNNWNLELDWNHLREMIRYSSAGFLGILAEQVLGNLFLFVLSVASGSNEAGLFVVSIMMTNTLAFLANAVKVVVLPRAAASSGNVDDGRVLRMLLLIEILMAAMLLLVGRYLLIFLYGPQFEGSFMPAVVLVPGVISSTICGVLSASIQGRGKPGRASLAVLAGSACAIICGLTLISRFGILGAAAGSSIANVASAIAAILIYSRITQTPIRTLFVFKENEVRDLVAYLATRLSGA